MKQNWIHASNLYLFNLSTKNLSSLRSRGMLPKEIFKKGKHRDDYSVDINFFQRRKNFQFRIWHENIALYNFIVDGMDQIELARMLSRITGRSETTWTKWLNYEIGSPLSESLTSYKITGMQYAFHRICTWLVRIHMRNRKYKSRDFEIMHNYREIKENEKN